MYYQRSSRILKEQRTRWGLSEVQAVAKQMQENVTCNVIGSLVINQLHQQCGKTSDKQTQTIKTQPVPSTTTGQSNISTPEVQSDSSNVTFYTLRN